MFVPFVIDFHTHMLDEELREICTSRNAITGFGQKKAAPSAQLRKFLDPELQIADILTTNRALAIPGVWELNPLMAMSQAKFGAAWWVPKLTVVAYLCLAATWMRRRWPIIFAVSVSGLAVLGNISHF